LAVFRHVDERVDAILRVDVTRIRRKPALERPRFSCRHERHEGASRMPQAATSRARAPHAGIRFIEARLQDVTNRGVARDETLGGDAVHDDGLHSFRSCRRSRPTSESEALDRKSTRLNSSHVKISYAVFCLK